MDQTHGVQPVQEMTVNAEIFHGLDLEVAENAVQIGNVALITGAGRLEQTGVSQKEVFSR